MLIERGETAEEAISKVRKARPGAIETAVQIRFLNERAAILNRRTAAIRASLFGSAIGDALGAEIEFSSLENIRRRFPDGITEIPPHDGHVGAITDDTQMTLFTAEGLCRATIRAKQRGICSPSGVVHHALLRWLATQGEQPSREVCDVGLISDPRMHCRRAPGMTCLSSLRAAGSFGEIARNDSKGCGTIMRVSPIGLSAPRDQIVSLAMETSALTHGHRTGQEAAVAWALILHDVMHGETLDMAARCVVDHVGRETADAIARARAAPRDGRAETVETLGGGWVAEEALSIALYACLCAEDIETGLRIAVTHSGDSDSTGAIAGSLLGLSPSANSAVVPSGKRNSCSGRFGGPSLR